MNAPIRTYWHKMRAVIKRGDVYTSAPMTDHQHALLSNEAYMAQIKRTENLAQKANRYELDHKKLGKFLDLFEQSPYFVIGNDLVPFATKPECHISMVEMKEAGCLRMPYPVSVVEMENLNRQGTTTRYFILLRDLQDPSVADPMEFQNDTRPDIPALFWAMSVRLERDEEGDYVVISPGMFGFNIEMRNDEPWLAIKHTESPLFNEALLEKDKLVDRTYKRDSKNCFIGLSALLLVANTEGVAKQVIETHKLNRKRKASGGTYIPRHTYIHIGRVYHNADSNSSDDYVPRKSPIPHWRRGHSKHIAYGPKRSERRIIWINAKLVAVGDSDRPAPTYKVST